MCATHAITLSAASGSVHPPRGSAERSLGLGAIDEGFSRASVEAGMGRPRVRGAPRTDLAPPTAVETREVELSVESDAAAGVPRVGRVGATTRLPHPPERGGPRQAGGRAKARRR